MQRLCIDRKARDPLTLNVERVFMHLFTKMTGRRDARRQSAFRKAAIAAYNAINPEQNNESLWCPITQAYWPKAAVEAAHIFPRNYGQSLMDQTFAGDAVNEEARDKLWSPRDGLPMLSAAEERFYKHLLVIVPLVENESDGAQVKAWHDNDPKRYALRIVDPTTS